MSVSYTKISLNVFYNGKMVDVIKMPLEEMDNFTGSCISKYDLLNNLIKSKRIKDTYILEFLKQIKDNCQSIFPPDEECNFYFALSTGGENGIVMPVIYNQLHFNHSEVFKQLENNYNLFSILSKYKIEIETDSKNITIINKIIGNIKISDFKNAKEELYVYGNLKNNGLIDKFDKDYLVGIKSISRGLSEIKEQLGNLTYNLKNSLYKTHMLLSLIKQFDGIQPKENILILNSNSKKFKDVRNILQELSPKLKEKKHD